MATKTEAARKAAGVAIARGRGWSGEVKAAPDLEQVIVERPSGGSQKVMAHHVRKVLREQGIGEVRRILNEGSLKERRRMLASLWDYQRPQMEHQVSTRLDRYGIEEYRFLWEDPDMVDELRSEAFIGAVAQVFAYDEEKAGARTSSSSSYFAYGSKHYVVEAIRKRALEKYPGMTRYYNEALVKAKKAGITDVGGIRTPEQKAEAISRYNEYLEEERERKGLPVSAGYKQKCFLTPKRMDGLIKAVGASVDPDADPGTGPCGRRGPEGTDDGGINSVIEAASPSAPTREGVSALADGLFHGEDRDFFEAWFEAAYGNAERGSALPVGLTKDLGAKFGMAPRQVSAKIQKQREALIEGLMCRYEGFGELERVYRRDAGIAKAEEARRKARAKAEKAEQEKLARGIEVRKGLEPRMGEFAEAAAAQAKAARTERAKQARAAQAKRAKAAPAGARRAAAAGL